MMSDNGPAEPKLSPVDQIKIASDYLRGTIAEELANDEESFHKDTTQVLKHFGTYQQDDRDARMAARARGEKSGKFFIMMVRSRVPGGKITAAHLLAELDLADRIGDGTLRLTTRQGFQLHGIPKHSLAETIRIINEIGLSTLGACGDVNRNVMCSPLPYKTPVFEQMQALSDELAEHFALRTPAYRELFLKDLETGEQERVAGGPDEEIEPIYGRQYLPRKFKMAIGLPEENSVDLHAHDLTFMAIVEQDQIVGYNVLVGGGFGVTPAKKSTFPALAQKLCFARPEQVLDIATAVVKVQRDFGNRSDRKHARMKYLIHNWGIEKFRDQVAEYYGQPLQPPHPAEVTDFDDAMGWREQGDGKLFYGLNVENGRIKDEGEFRLKSALRVVASEFGFPMRITPHQSLIFCDIEPSQRGRLETIFREHGVPLTEDFSTVRRWSMACVAWPTCGLAITESERALPDIMSELEPVLTELGLEQERFTVRMTGCPNGCARPYNSDIGIVGKAKDRYTLYLGGRVQGNRLSFIYKDLVPREELVPTLRPLFAYFKADRTDSESFGDFCARKGEADLAAHAANGAG